MPVEPQLATRQDFAQIVSSLADFWGERDVRHLHHPTAIEEFGDSALVIHDAAGQVAAYLFGMIVAARQLAYVHVVAVREDHRGCGHARRLYRAYADLAVARGCTTLKAITAPTNRESIAFHQSVGMRAEEIPDYSGPGQSRVVLTRTLPPCPHRGRPPLPGLVVRRAIAEDVDALLDFWRVSAEDADRPTDRRPAVQALLARDPDAILLAVLDGSIVGCVIAGWDGWRAHLYRLAVHPAHRRHGLGRRLLDAAEQRLAAHGAIRFDAMVLNDNETAQRMWSASGYTSQTTWSRWVKPVN